METVTEIAQFRKYLGIPHRLVFGDESDRYVVLVLLDQFGELEVSHLEVGLDLDHLVLLNRVEQPVDPVLDFNEGL